MTSWLRAGVDSGWQDWHGWRVPTEHHQIDRPELERRVNCVESLIELWDEDFSLDSKTKKLANLVASNPVGCGSRALVSRIIRRCFVRIFQYAVETNAFFHALAHEYFALEQSQSNPRTHPI